MKALRWYSRKDVRYEDIPEPVPGRGEVKVRVNLSGICGTDLREYATGPCMIAPDKAPITLGHEFAGIVAALGVGVTDFKIGDRVTGLGYRICGECYCCKRMKYNICYNQGFSGLTADGCMAEYMVAPDYTYFKLPDSVSDELGSLVEPLSVAIHAVKQGRVQAGDKVAIVGDGTIGLSILMAARAAGASEVYLVSKHKQRAEKALAMGATAVINSNDATVKELQRLTGGLGADVSFESVGNADTAQLAVSLARRDGIAVIVGVFEKAGMFHFADVVFGEKTIIGSSIYVREAEAAIAMLADKRIQPQGLITSVIPLKDAVNSGFEQLLRDKENNLKILLKKP